LEKFKIEIKFAGGICGRFWGRFGRFWNGRFGSFGRLEGFVER
jgi:hypothetical protein